MCSSWVSSPAHVASARAHPHTILCRRAPPRRNDMHVDRHNPARLGADARQGRPGLQEPPGVYQTEVLRAIGPLPLPLCVRQQNIRAGSTSPSHAYSVPNLAAILRRFWHRRATLFRTAMRGTRAACRWPPKRAAAPTDRFLLTVRVRDLESQVGSREAGRHKKHVHT
jgi:hypothetical protein